MINSCDIPWHDITSTSPLPSLNFNELKYSEAAGNTDGLRLLA